MSNTVSSAQHVLSVHNMLLAIGDNSDNMRTMNYVGKDIIGQLGSLGYMAKMAKNADQNPRKFLAYSNISQQASYIVVCTAPYIPQELFLGVTGSANIMINISFTGFGAVNAKCISILAEDNNIGEIYAKITVINTVGSSIGMLCGLCIMGLIPENELRMMLIPLLGIIRVYSYNKAIEGIIGKKDIS